VAFEIRKVIPIRLMDGLMDRGIPTEETIEKMKGSEYPIKYLIGTPKGRLTKLEKKISR